jgi:hypothetical protein
MKRQLQLDLGAVTSVLYSLGFLLRKNAANSSEMLDRRFDP